MRTRTPFFIERAGRAGAAETGQGAINPSAAIAWLELASDADALDRWLGGRALPVRVVDGEPGVWAVGLGERELRTPPGHAPSALE